MLCLALYNMFFIPLQFAYRIEFKGIYLALEVLTIIIYLVEIATRVVEYKKLRKVVPEVNLESKMFSADNQKLQERLSVIKFEVVTTSLALFPISLIAQAAKWFHPFGVYLLLCSIRIIKLRPVKKFWRWTQKYSLNVMRAVEAVFYYYFAIHWFACINIGMAVHEPDHRLTWLRRVPAPIFTSRSTPNVFDDVSPLVLYNHAQNF